MLTFDQNTDKCSDTIAQCLEYFKTIVENNTMYDEYF